MKKKIAIVAAIAATATGVVYAVHKKLASKNEN